MKDFGNILGFEDVPTAKSGVYWAAFQVVATDLELRDYHLLFISFPSCYYFSFFTTVFVGPFIFLFYFNGFEFLTISVQSCLRTRPSPHSA